MIWDGKNWVRSKSSSGSSVAQRTVKNLYPANSETFAVLNSNTVAAASTGVPLVNAPAGLKTGAQVGTTSFTQYNLPIIADSFYWVYSFYARPVDGAVGAQVQVSTGTGINAVQQFQCIYDFDAPLTASTGVYPPSLAATIGANWVVQDVGSGWKRFSAAYKNNGTGTLFVIQHTGSVAANKVIHAGFMLERIADDGSSLLPSVYSPTGQVAPFLNQGKSGLKIVREPRFTFNQVAVISDSIWGSGTNYKLATAVGSAIGLVSTIAHGGANTAVVLADKLANAGGINFSKALVIYNVGRNDDITTSASRQAIVSQLSNDIANLGHSNYLVCGILPKFVSSAVPGTEETNAVNISLYNGIREVNNLMAVSFPGKFIDLHKVSVNSYDPTSAADIVSFGLDARPVSLVGAAAADNLHPADTENQVLAAAVIDFIYNNYLV